MEVKIERLDDFGRGIAYIDNKICFIENALPNEVVEIVITKEKKSYLEAKVINYLNSSKLRKESNCPYYQNCGGWSLEHLSIEDENKYKLTKVQNLLSKFTNLDKRIVHDIICHDTYNYRNKLILHGENGKLGLYQKGTHKIIEIEECLLVNKKINLIIKGLIRSNKSIEEAIIKTSNDEKLAMVKITGEVKDITNLEKIVDVIIINNKLFTKESKILTTIGTKKYYESISSFFQVNETLTEVLYNEALDVVKKIKPNKLLDLYCGVGTIGIYVSDYCKEIIGIDYNKSNISDANNNKKLNKLSNIAFICDKVENQIATFKDIDLIIVDPPRAGLDKKTRQYLKEISPQTIIYISCNPVTLVRDLNELESIYQVESIKLFNMFPRSYHVESICVLKLH